MRFLVFLLVFLSSCKDLEVAVSINHVIQSVKTDNKLIRIAIIDTGMNLDDKWPYANNASMVQPKICPGLSKDFTDTTILDEHGHGTHLAGLIAKYAGNVNYCLVIYKYFKVDAEGMVNMDRSIKAFKEAIRQKVDFINYSGGGVIRSEEECKLVTLALNNGIKIVAAAGNEGSDLKFFHFYPAMCDPRVTIVEGVDELGKRMKISNYSSSSEITTYREPGHNQFSLLPGGQYGYMTGTSQATAIHTGKMVALKAKER